MPRAYKTCKICYVDTMNSTSFRTVILWTFQEYSTWSRKSLGVNRARVHCLHNPNNQNVNVLCYAKEESGLRKSVDMRPIKRLSKYNSNELVNWIISPAALFTGWVHVMTSSFWLTCRFGNCFGLWCLLLWSWPYSHPVGMKTQ